MKLAYVSYLGSNPHAENPWLDRTLVSYLTDPIETPKAIEALLLKSLQFWYDANTKDATLTVGRAIEIAEKSGDIKLCQLPYIRMTSFLLSLDRLDEATRFLNAIEEISDQDNGQVRIKYYRQKAIVAATLGHATEAFNYFEQAVYSAKEQQDVFDLLTVWSSYAFWASALGKTESAKAAYERTCFLSRQHHIVRYIPFACLDYAHFLFRIGHPEAAYEYLMGALSYEVNSMQIKEAIAEVGIPLALYFKDEAMLAKCANTAVIEFVFRGGQPNGIGPVASEFAKWYISCKREHDAQVLLRRAVESVRNVIQTWDLPLAVAQYGTLSCVPKARKLIEQRVALPNSEVAQACLSLFDAFVLRRHGKNEQANAHALQAVESFDALGWHGYSDIARAQLPATSTIPPRKVHVTTAFSTVQPLLTSREREIAELVLKGYANRAIAFELSITENTVEKHMTSIMNRLGIRSRYQLANAVGSNAISAMGLQGEFRIP